MNTKPASQQRFRENLEQVRQRIADAAARSGRTADDVTLVGVTKYVDAETTRQFVQAGCRCLGESRPQQLWDKSAALADLSIEWHMIGHLQRNKVKRTLESVSLIHSVDSLRLLKAINRLAQEQQLVASVLLEINVSGESAKHGFQSIDELKSVVDASAEMENVKVDGLMAMAGLQGTLDDARREFVCLREMKNELTDLGLPPNVELRQLSMGMSGDFEVAIEEGATIVRVGSALFQ
ncbi:MAG: YggS family pyridoxal phosphate-dependent enzyme [Planctomycetota bacterium]